MTMPSPFEMGRAIGGNVAGAVHRSSQGSTMDNILKQAQETGDPTQFNNIMSQILQRVDPENQANVINAVKQRQQQLQQKDYYQSQGLNPNIANMPESIQKEIVKWQASPDQNKMQPLLTGLDIVSRQRDLLKKGNLGPKVAFTGTGRKAGSTFSKEGIKDRAEYQRLGKSLISLATTIPIRNRLEFETLSQGLYDPNAKQEEIEGALEGMQRIIQNNLGATGSPQQQQPQADQLMQQQQPQQFMPGQTATNPQTGKTITFNGTNWE